MCQTKCDQLTRMNIQKIHHIWYLFSTHYYQQNNANTWYHCRMSVFDQYQTAGTNEGDLVARSKLHPTTADHNMNSATAGPGEAKHANFPFSGFPRFPFLPGVGHPDSLPGVPLSLNLTGQLDQSRSSPHSHSNDSEHSPKSSPTGN